MDVIDSLVRNLRYAARVLVKSPAFTAAAITTLALGIGANTAIFSLVKTVMLAPLPYVQPERLVMVWNMASPDDMTWLSAQEVVHYRNDAASFERLGAYIEGNANLTGGQEPERVRTAQVTGELFETLGIAPLLGRGITTPDSTPTSADVVVLAYGLWQRRFGGDPSIIGQEVPVNGRLHTVVGVMPDRFRLPLDFRADRPTELYMPQGIDPANLGQWGSRSFLAVARLKPQTAAAAASSELDLLERQWIQAGYIQSNDGNGLNRSAVPILEFLTGRVRQPLLILMGAVGVVLLIACVNVVNLLLSRADARRREMAVRGALGAERRQLVHLLLTESILLSCTAGAAGLAVAAAALQVLRVMRPAGLPRVEEAALDPTALLFTGGLSLATGVLFGLLPAVQLSREGFAPVLNETGRSGAAGRTRVVVRRGLVVAQLACSLVLVVAAGLLLRSLVELQRIDLGLDPARVLTAQLQLPTTSYADPGKVVQFYRELTDRLGQLPGVAAAGAVRVLPLARTIGDFSISIEGRPTLPGENPNGDYQSATPGYFHAIGLALLRGRLLTAADREDAPPVVVINDTMAARYWPGQDALGQRFQMGGPGSTRPMMTIVGIVKTSRHNAVVEEPRAEMYLPHAQLPTSVGGPGRSMAVVIKAHGDGLPLANQLRATIRELDPTLPGV